MRERERAREHVTSRARRVEVSFQMIGRKPAVKHLGVKPEGCKTPRLSARGEVLGLELQALYTLIPNP